MSGESYGLNTIPFPAIQKPAASLNGLPPKRSGVSDGEEDLHRVCGEMESLFLNYLLKEMRDTVPKDGLVGKSTAGGIYESMLDSEMSRTLSEGEGIGLKAVLLRQLNPHLESRSDDDSENTDNSVKGFPGPIR